jgi:putative membrane protein insertion efficiency factor
MNNEPIPHYINNPALNAATAPELKLIRPDIDFKRAVSVLTLYISGVICLTFVLSFAFIAPAHGVVTAALFMPLAFRVLPYAFIVTGILTLRFALIWLVKVYQHYAKSETRLRCCFTPSCSEYAILALKKYGVFVGGIKTVLRLLRCHSPNGGEDYP